MRLTRSRALSPKGEMKYCGNLRTFWENAYLKIVVVPHISEFFKMECFVDPPLFRPVGRAMRRFRCVLDSRDDAERPEMAEPRPERAQFFESNRLTQQCAPSDIASMTHLPLCNEKVKFSL